MLKRESLCCTYSEGSHRDEMNLIKKIQLNGKSCLKLEMNTLQEDSLKKRMEIGETDWNRIMMFQV